MHKCSNNFSYFEWLTLYCSANIVRSSLPFEVSLLQASKMTRGTNSAGFQPRHAFTGVGLRSIEASSCRFNTSLASAAVVLLRPIEEAALRKTSPLGHNMSTTGTLLGAPGLTTRNKVRY